MLLSLFISMCDQVERFNWLGRLARNNQPSSKEKKEKKEDLSEVFELSSKHSIDKFLII